MRKDTAPGLREQILQNLDQYEHCSFLLRRALGWATEQELQKDLAFYCHFLDPDQMQTLEEVFVRGMAALGLTKQQLKHRAEFNLDAQLERGNFEAFRAVLRAAAVLNSLQLNVSLASKSLGDLVTDWFGEEDFCLVYNQVKQQLANADIHYLCFLKDSFSYEYPSLNLTNG